MMSRYFRAGGAAILVLAISAAFVPKLRAQELAAVCSGLAERALPHTKITSAQIVPAGGFAVPGTTNTVPNLPSFCRVTGVIAPRPESEILFEVWMPVENWNGKFAAVGNGGWAGNISYMPLGDQLRRGYATASTNTGHPAAPGFNAARFAFEQPERLIDFAYRSQHETGSRAKALVEAFYGKAPARSYFIGCSSGGYQGLMEAQRFPDDYDGILAMAPANNWTRLMAGDLDGVLAVLKDPASNLSLNALGLLHRSAMAECDALDGVTDGVLEDPRQCKFDPARLTCKDGQASDSCLTTAQVEAARRVYRGLRDPKSGAQLYPGLVPGSEPFWPHRDPGNPFPIPISHYKWLVFANPDWDWKTFEFDDPADYQAHLAAEAKLAPILNATNPDLSAFRKRGGRLLHWHGWNDQLIAPQNSIDYYESVKAHFGTSDDLGSFYRLFMVPGIAHCAGGTGPNTFDMQIALERWVERGVAPDEVMATRLLNGVVDRSRPLCLYPKTAVYSGKGDTNDAANFVCSDPKPRNR